MTLPGTLTALRWLARDTMRQARASGVFWVVLLVTFVSTTVCLSIGVSGEPQPAPLRPWETRQFLPRAEAERLNPDVIAADGVEVPTGEFTLFFGAIRLPLARTGAESVRFVQVVLAGGLADTLGVLLALAWTAGFLPTFLDPASASVLLVKPLPRGALLAGKCLGVFGLVALQAALFIGLTWLALGFATGVWDGRYLLSLPILLVHFALFFCASAFLAVLTRSTVASVVGTLAFWLVCWAANYARHSAIATLPAGTATAGSVVEFAYWLLPKPADLGVMLVDAIEAGSYLARVPALQAASERGLVMPELSLLTSCLIPVLLLIAAGRRLARADY